MSDFLRQIWDNSQDMHQRFGIELYPGDRRYAFNEEARELMDESITAVAFDITLTMSLAREAFDVIYATIGILQAHGVSYEDFEVYAREKLAQNDAKTIQNGYGVVDRKIKPIS